VQSVAGEAERWVPFSRRGKAGAEEWHALEDGVADHLRPSLMGVVTQGLSLSTGNGASIQRTLRLALGDGPVQNTLMATASADDETLLDITDCLLSEACNHYRADPTRAYNLDARIRQDAMKENAIAYAANLRRILAESNSVFEVDLSDGKQWGLRRRVDETATRAVEMAVAISNDAGALLASAWSSTFQREPDLVRAYRDVVLAVEAAACPVLIPTNTMPTLGTAISRLKQSTPTWTVAGLDDKAQQSAETLLAMLETIWQNHSRHAEHGGKAPDLVEQQEAEAVLFLAVTVVQWFERGMVQPRP